MKFSGSRGAKIIQKIVALLTLGFCSICSAEVPPVTGTTSPLTAESVPTDHSQDIVTVPVLTPVTVELVTELGSKISTTGQRFPIVLKSPIIVEGREVVAAGAIGEGEVVHAKKAGGGGTGGELVLAARFLNVDARLLKLRSMRIAMTGKDAIDAVRALNAASAVSPVPFGLLGHALTGKNIVVPAGTVAQAKTSEPFTIATGSLPEGGAASATIAE